MPDSIETRFVDAGDMRFELSECGNPTSRRLALCLHGFPEHAFSWRHQLPLLARLGYKAWAPNQRGYGASTRPHGARHYTIELLVRDVTDLVRAADCDSVTLIGHDWGGLVAWMTALGSTCPIERLVVMNLPHPAVALRQARTLRQLRRSWYIFFFQLPWLPETLLRLGGARAIGDAFRNMALDKSRFPDSVLDVYRRQALEPGALTAMLNWYRALRLRRRRLERELRDAPVLEVPTLLVWGEHDSALGVELTYGTEALVKDLTVRYLPDVSHWVQQEAPEQVNAILEAWLTQRPVPGSPRSSEQLAGGL